MNIQQNRSASTGHPVAVVVNNECSQCSTLTDDEVKNIFTSATPEKQKALKNAFNEANQYFGLTSCQQKVHFFAQVLQEVGTSIDIEYGESLNYRIEELPKQFKAFRIKNTKEPNELAYKYGAINKKNKDRFKTMNYQKANEEMIANIAYANRNGNGDINSGDGWEYRGGGILQITFKNNYDKINKTIKKYYPDFNVEIHSGNINNIREGTIASMAYWLSFGCKQYADKGVDRVNFDKIVDIINKNTDSRESRWSNLKKMIIVFNLYDCKKVNYEK